MKREMIALILSVASFGCNVEVNAPQGSALTTTTASATTPSSSDTSSGGSSSPSPSPSPTPSPTPTPGASVSHYLYAASRQANVIFTYLIDDNTGAVTRYPQWNSETAACLRPEAMVISPTNSMLYAICYQGDPRVYGFKIESNGVLTPVTMTGATMTNFSTVKSMAISADGSLILVKGRNPSNTANFYNEFSVNAAGTNLTMYSMINDPNLTFVNPYVTTLGHFIFSVQVAPSTNGIYLSTDSNPAQSLIGVANGDPSAIIAN